MRRSDVQVTLILRMANITDLFPCHPTQSKKFPNWIYFSPVDLPKSLEFSFVTKVKKKYELITSHHVMYFFQVFITNQDIDFICLNIIYWKLVQKIKQVGLK